MLADAVQTFVSALSKHLVLPDFWQQQAVHALRAGHDVVVHAPTGAGKTFVFELFQPELKGQAVFTVPTRALANDKLAEWQQRGWDVGISTGDIALRLDAHVVVATLETQKGRFLRRDGPRLLVVDEYQMIGDGVRGVNYELAIALAPPTTQLLLLSGSVGNPEDIAAWLRRIGRTAEVVTTYTRPVPLQEVDLDGLPDNAPPTVKGWWPRRITNALREGFGPILLFAPRRKAAEELATQLASALPSSSPLSLTLAQEQLAGNQLARLLAQRVAYHHSGLTYAQRSQLIEPLAKAGQLRVVVATMGLAAGINFSMRSVAITGTQYAAGPFQRQVSPDELLQMFGRAGRRGLDDEGFALVAPKPPRLLDAAPRHLRRAAPVDWPSFLAVMHAATLRGDDPFEAAAHLNQRLFSTQTVPLGIEHSAETGPMPCGLQVDMERARYLRRGVTEMKNSRAEWEPLTPVENVAIRDLHIWDGERWRSALSLSETLKPLSVGTLCKLEAGRAKRYGREVVLGSRKNGVLILAPWLRTRLAVKVLDADAFQARVLDRLPELTEGGRLESMLPRGEQLVVRLDYGELPRTGHRDRYGVFLQNPPTRREMPEPCRTCPEQRWCANVPIVNTPASDWGRLGLIDAHGAPTQRGLIFSFFLHGEGLAVAAALEDPEYPVEDMVYDLANLRAGPRFAGDESPIHGGRLGFLSQQAFDRADMPGYLQMGVPPDYGAGASEVMRQIVEHRMARNRFVSDALRLGDIERAFIEWRSLLRHIQWSPDHPMDRWLALKKAAAAMLERTDKC